MSDGGSESPLVTLRWRLIARAQVRTLAFALFVLVSRLVLPFFASFFAFFTLQVVGWLVGCGVCSFLLIFSFGIAGMSLSCSSGPRNKQIGHVNSRYFGTRVVETLYWATTYHPLLSPVRTQRPLPAISSSSTLYLQQQKYLP